MAEKNSFVNYQKSYRCWFWDFLGFMKGYCQFQRFIRYILAILRSITIEWKIAKKISIGKHLPIFNPRSIRHTNSQDRIKMSPDSRPNDHHQCCRGHSVSSSFKWFFSWYLSAMSPLYVYLDCGSGDWFCCERSFLFWMKPWLVDAAPPPPPPPSSPPPPPPPPPSPPPSPTPSQHLMSLVELSTWGENTKPFICLLR